jgi:O-antigen/teichoic acid export membrane protein
MTFLISKIAQDNIKPEDELIGTALISAFLLGLFVTAIVYIFVPYYAKNWMMIDRKLLNEVVLAFQVSALGILPGVLSNTLKGILEGKSKFKESNICKIFSGASVFIAPMIVITFESKNLVHISAAIVLTRYLSLILYAIYTTRLSSLIFIKLRREHLKSIWNYGLWAALSGLISTSFVYGDRFLVAGYLSSQDLSVYIASQDVLIRYLLIPWSMAIVLMPTFSADNISKIKVLELYRHQQKRVALISFFILLLVPSLTLYIARVVNHTTIPANVEFVVAIQVVGIFFCAMSQLPLIYLYGKGMPRLITNIYLFELLIYILMAPIIFRCFGIIGACFVWSGRLVIEYFLLRHYAERLIR